MQIALIADTYPPNRNSGAIQLNDLANEFVRQGHHITVILPSSEITESWRMDEINGIKVVRLYAHRLKTDGNISRALSELLMPLFMIKNWYVSPYSKLRYDGIVWYSPSIFHGPLVGVLKKTNGCKAYLIIRDIFPEWAVDMGLMKKGLAYYFFKMVAKYQYSIANVIGVQTEGNLPYFKKWSDSNIRRLEVLQNWLADSYSNSCSICLAETTLAGRDIFVYAGNMGLAQGMDILIDLAGRLRLRQDIGFVFVGRGTETKKIKERIKSMELNNILFYDEIHPNEIAGLYKQCSVGLLALDVRHKTHNIPGKFLSYMRSGLPVLACVNSGNDLIGVIRKEGLGHVIDSQSPELLEKLAASMIEELKVDNNFSSRCKSYYQRMYAPEIAVNQILFAIM